MNIKIFVSRRIDLDSLRIDNQLYVPVRCGAIYDKDKGQKIIGDNTGENISFRRNSFCEFTVQYWAWKNIKADYYGLCHYRRYLTFSQKKFKANVQEQIMEGFLDHHSIKKYELQDHDCMRNIIEDNDAVVNVAADVRCIPTPQGVKETVYEHWAAHDQVFIDKRTLPLLLETIEELFPEISLSAQEYLDGSWHRGYNCYVMRKILFTKMCEFQFGVLFAMEEKLKIHKEIDWLPRTMGYLGEIMYGIYIFHLMKQKKYKIKELQLVYFEQTQIPDCRLEYYVHKILFWAKIRFEDLGYVLLPKASGRRKFIKKIYFFLIGKGSKKE